MDLSVESDDGDVVRVLVTGNVNQKEINPLADPIGSLLGDEAYSRNVLLDMSDIQMLDSAGVSWLLSNHRRFRESGGHLVLHSLSLLARNVFKVLNMHKVFNIVADERDALESVRGESS